MRDDTGPVLTPQMLLHAYQAGIFPMSENRDDDEVFWVDPRMRGVIPLDGFRVSRSLAKRIRSAPWTVTRNQAFAEVVAACAAREETWISGGIASLYNGLHRMGHGHSLEIWNTQGALVGGVYGVTAGTAFFGESMFSRERDASKVALAYLVTHLARQGFTLFDTQFITDHLASLGAVEISRSTYHARLHAALQQTAQFGAGQLPTAQEVLQRRTQTS
ncbi:MAG: leucyl/phenylalanyl-tRNA--protein transferase [Pseudomonadota bacterium]